jgi:hypothetical protein
MALYVAFFRFREGMGLVEGMQAFERRKTFTHPPRAAVVAEFWVNAPAGLPQVVLAWEAEDEGPGDYYEAAWGDLFEITIAPATRPVAELPPGLAGLAGDGGPFPG